VKYQSLTVKKYYKLCKVITYMPCIFMFLKVYSFLPSEYLAGSHLCWARIACPHVGKWKLLQLCKVITYMPCIFMFLKVYSDSFCFKLFLPDKLKSYQTSYLYLGQEFHYMSCRMITNLLSNGKRQKCCFGAERVNK
jgi:hypothetical protein